MAINDFAYEAGGGVAMEAFKYKQVFVKLNQKCSHHQENLGSNAIQKYNKLDLFH